MTDTLAIPPSLKSPETTLGRRVGSDSLSDVTLMEDHDEALRVWQRGNFSNRTLLHIDAHIDFDWIPERSFSDLLNVTSRQELETLTQEKVFWNFTDRRNESFIHIGNYICLALRQGIVSTFYWVTPEAPPGISWQKEMGILFREFQRDHPHAFTGVSVEEKRAQAKIYGFPLIVCTLQSLPSVEEEVLLDIDTDFLISGFLSEHEEDPRSKKPWFFPDELVSALRVKGIRSDCVTIAYSVEGGFTPLRYKYFGDALAQFIRDPSSNRDSYEHKKSALAFEEKGKIKETISEYQEILEVHPEDAATLYTLSLLFLQRGDKEKAARLYQGAIAADPAYATSYNNFGPLYEESGQWQKAKEEYEKMLLLDSENVHALCGVGNVFRVQKNVSAALSYYQKALSKNPKVSGVYYGLGRIFFQKREWDEAFHAFQKALELKGPEAMLRFWIGAAFFRKKLFREAKENLLAAARLGFHSLSLHRYLFWIYSREGLTYKMAREGKKLFLLLGWRTRSRFLHFFRRR